MFLMDKYAATDNIVRTVDFKFQAQRMYTTMGTGRKRIEIQEIKETAKRRVTLSKRRQGLFKKLRKLQDLAGCAAFCSVFSTAGRKFDSGSPLVLRNFVSEGGDVEGRSVCDSYGNGRSELEFDEKTLDLDEMRARVDKLEEMKREYAKTTCHGNGYFSNFLEFDKQWRKLVD